MGRYVRVRELARLSSPPIARALVAGVAIRLGQEFRDFITGWGIRGFSSALWVISVVQSHLRLAGRLGGLGELCMGGFFLLILEDPDNREILPFKGLVFCGWRASPGILRGE